MTPDYSLRSAIDTPLFHLISEAADELGVEAYVVGGYVRDLLLHRTTGDIVDEKRDQFFRELVRTVIIGAVAKHNVQSVGIMIGANEMIARSL